MVRKLNYGFYLISFNYRKKSSQKNIWLTPFIIEWYPVLQVNISLISLDKQKRRNSLFNSKAVRKNYQISSI